VAAVRTTGGSVDSVAFRNVPSYVVARDVPAGAVSVDLAYGGALYASVPAERLGLRVDAAQLPQLIEAGRAVKRALDRDVYGTIIWEEVGPRHQRNVTIFADGEVDRSPCGSGTSARLALLAEEGAIGVGDVLRHDSIVDTTFHARIVGETADGVLTEVEGTAYRTGEHRFVLDRRDGLGTGFVLR
jgi:proline racemase